MFIISKNIMGLQTVFIHEKAKELVYLFFIIVYMHIGSLHIIDMFVFFLSFVFHDFVSIKVEDKVTYPLEGLDLSSFASGPFTGELIYDLQACVCHDGGMKKFLHIFLVRVSYILLISVFTFLNTR